MQPTLIDRIINRIFGLMVKLGFGLSHNFLLEVRGRKSGRIYSTPVNVLDYQEKKYLVAPRGDTQWVRNVVVSLKGDSGEGSQARKCPFASDSRRGEGRNLESLSRSLQTHSSAIFPRSPRVRL